MKDKHKHSGKLINGIIAIVTVLAVIGVSFTYVKSVEKKVSEETGQYLEEVGIQSAALIKQKFDDDLENLKSAAAVIGATDLALNDDAIMTSLRQIDEALDFRNVAVVEPDGTAYEIMDNEVYTFEVMDKEHFRYAIVGVPFISNPTVPEDHSEESIALAVPIYRDNAVIGVIMGRYYLTDLTELLNVDTFDGKGYAYLTRRNGEVFVTSNNENADRTLKDINTDFEDSYFEDPFALQTMQINMLEGKSGSVDYVWNGTKRIMRYLPVGINDWYLLSVVPNEVIESKATGLVMQAAVFCCILFGVFIVLSLYVLGIQKRKNEELRKTHRELETNERRYEIVMAQSKDIIFEWDIKTGHIYHSDMFRQKFGFESPVERFPEAVVECQGIPESDVEVFLQTYRKIADGEPYAEGEFRVYDSRRCPMWCRSRVSLIVDENGEPSRGVGILMDIDEEMQEKEKMMAAAEKDFLTQTFNKGAAESRIQQWMKENEGKQKAGLLMIDVDDFKQVNDTFGHISGDRVLREVTKKISGIFRESDIVGRIGGDEFVVLMKNIQDTEAVTRKAQEIIQIFENCRVGVQKKYSISGSIGIALFPENGTTYKELLGNADQALYFAKAHGKNQFIYFKKE
ncbi:diguanylate cyclase [Eubacterium sp. 1001713B170207_170306_E7]|uniref:sensor domain-containing diguanylate cyclase n=1 Tax=Eubacterium sp. 1001713B170207_170306_E7 TaxID=2787097 RepID=UPI0018989B77|nr:diguanylate cyclase [Eubacterium sp. 1001713B170207_170306_E7]